MTKICFLNIITDFLNFLNQLKEPQIQNFVYFRLLSEMQENGISRDFGSEMYILSSTMETFVALK